MLVRTRIFSGAVLEQYVYHAPARCKDPARAKLRPRFADEEARRRHRDEIARRRHARRFNATFGPDALYITLTCDDEHELYSFRDAKKELDNYVRRIRYAYPESVVFAYKGRGKATERIHFHLVARGIPRHVIVRQWKLGTVKRIKRLREHNYYDGVDHGRDYTGLANYLFNHWSPEQGGHRYKVSGETGKIDAEAPKEVKRTYGEDKAPRPPKGYMLVETRSTAYGYLYYKYVLIPPRDPRGKAPDVQIDWDE